MEGNDNITYRKEVYTEVIQDGHVIASFKQNGHILFFKMTPLTAAALDKILGLDKLCPPSVSSPSQ